MKCHQSFLSKFPEAVKSDSCLSGVCCSPCVFTLMFVACHAWAGLLHSPGSYGRARHRWFIPPNLSCTVAGGRLPSAQRERGSISQRDHIISPHIIEVAASRSAAPGLVLGADVPTSRRSHVCDPEATSRALTIPTDAIALISYSFSNPPPTSL